MAEKTTDFFQQEQLISQINVATEQLQLDRSELARILGLHCDDVSDNVQLEILIDNSQPIRHQAERFVLMYRLIEEYCNKQQRHPANWFRQPYSSLQMSPFNAVIDQHQIETVITILKQEL